MLAMTRALWRSLRKDETAQALAEYCLVTALLALIALGIFIHVSGGMRNIWGAAGSAMANAGSTTPAGDATASAHGSR
jgi:Flp pilus assembly pilin Flp